MIVSGCSARYTADSGEITSPGFPDVMYANFQTCTWIIDIPSGSGFKLMLDRTKSFEIEDNVDFLEVKGFAYARICQVLHV